MPCVVRAQSRFHFVEVRPSLHAMGQHVSSFPLFPIVHMGLSKVGQLISVIRSPACTHLVLDILIPRIKLPICNLRIHSDLSPSAPGHMASHGNSLIPNRFADAEQGDLTFTTVTGALGKDDRHHHSSKAPPICYGRQRRIMTEQRSHSNCLMRTDGLREQAPFY